MSWLKGYPNDIVKYHKKNLKKINKEVYALKSPLEDYIVEYLKELRDYLTYCRNFTISDEARAIRKKEGHMNYLLDALLSALKEYEDYQSCFDKYYEKKGAQTIKKAKGTDVEVATKYSKERQKHLSAFWLLVSLNLREWTEYAGISKN